jgi:hypothetical protein
MESSIDQLQYNVVAFVINLIAAILLLRTYTGMTNSRFLLHLAIGFGIISLSHVMDAAVSAISLFPGVPLDDIKRLAEKVDLLFSCLSTFFFVLSFLLLWHYPNQSVRPETFASITGVLGVLVALVTFIQGPANDSYFLKTLDIFTSMVGCVCVGIGLVMIASAQTSIIVGWIAAAAFCLWGIAQLPFWFDYVSPNLHLLYFYSLSIIGLAAAIATIIFCALTLPDRVSYRRDDSVLSRTAD